MAYNNNGRGNGLLLLLMTGYPEQMPSLCLQELIKMFTSVEN